ELTLQPEDEPLAGHVLENGGARNHGRQHRGLRSGQTEPTREHQSAHERNFLEGDLAKGTVDARGITNDGDGVSRRELVVRQELVEALHAVSQIRWATRAYTFAIFTRPSTSRFSPSTGSGRPLAVQ